MFVDLWEEKKKPNIDALEHHAVAAPPAVRGSRVHEIPISHNLTFFDSDSAVRTSGRVHNIIEAWGHHTVNI